MTLLRMPDMFALPRGNSRGKAQADFCCGAALHDTEVLPGVFLQVGQIVGKGQIFSGGVGCSDARKGKIPEFLFHPAPGNEMPAAHIVHKMQGMDGSGGGGISVG